MDRNAYFSCCLVLTLAGLGGCSSQPDKSKTVAKAPDRIQGKAQIVLGESGAADAALNAVGSSAYLWEGVRRYRLFLRTPYEIVGGKEYIVEGLNAQKAIDEIGDPDQGKNGYPLLSSCERVVRTVWSGMALDVTDLHASVLRSRVKRYPARPVILVTKITPVPEKEGDEAAAKKKVALEADIPEITVPADKQKALQVEGAATQPAPLWEPTGGTVRCKIIIDTAGKVGELESGTQLCEAVPWDQFRWQPTVQRGRPVKVKTEVEVRFEPRK